MPQIFLETDEPRAICKILHEDGRSILVQTDTDAPGVASSFGWSKKDVQKKGGHCDHSGTDGTIDCPECGIKAATFIKYATDWINEHDGECVEDPGYFNH